MQPPQIFKISPQTLRALEKTNWTVFVHLTCAVFSFLFYIARTEQTDLFLNAVLFTLFLVGAGTISFIRHSLLVREHAEQFFIVADKGVYHKKNNAVIRLEHRKITRIVVKEETDGEYRELQLYTRSGVLKLRGFENMKRALEAMKPYVDDLVVICRKRPTFRAKPWIVVNIPLSAVALGIWGLYIHAPELLTIAQYAAWACAAMALWLGKPISRALGKRARRWEILLSCIFVVLIGYELGT